MNDYMAAYHDAVLLIGQVMRKIIENNASEVQEMEFMNVNYFRNTSFNGKKDSSAGNGAAASLCCKAVVRRGLVDTVVFSCCHHGDVCWHNQRARAVWLLSAAEQRCYRSLAGRA